MTYHETDRTKRKPQFLQTVGVRGRLLIYFLFFLIFLLIVVWFFQIFMMKPMYEKMKYRELKRIACEVSEAVGTSELEETVYRNAMNASTCVLVYRVDGEILTEIISVEALNRCTIHHLSEQSLLHLCFKVKESGGSYITKLTFGGAELQNTSESEEEGSTVSLTLTKGKNGKSYLILLNAELAPLNATVQTLKYQFIWISCVMVVLAVILAYLFSKGFSKPLVQMSQTAHQLAEGNYRVNFSGRGYREAEELAAALNYAAEELSKTDMLQKELIANISHDLRTPLTMIEGYAEVMRDIPDENTPENIQVIIEETKRLSELVADLLDLSKLQARTQKPDLTQVALTQLIREVLQRYTKLTEYDGYRIEFSADREVEILADRTMILQVVYNLINNAINYTGEDRMVRVIQTVRNQKVRISVADSGEGIDPEQIPMIWDRYYKTDRVHQRARIGTGLGLSIVKGIFELHHVAYGVESKKGNGSVFWFEFPLVSMFPEESKTI